MIYRVKELQRKEINSNYKSTIRYFLPSEIYTEEEFITAIKDGTIFAEKTSDESLASTGETTRPVWKSIPELWKPNYTSMWIQDMEDPKKRIIMVNTDGHGNLFRNRNGCIMYQYADNKGYTIGGRYFRMEYPLSRPEENTPKWRETNHHERTG